MEIDGVLWATWALVAIGALTLWFHITSSRDALHARLITSRIDKYGEPKMLEMIHLLWRFKTEHDHLDEVDGKKGFAIRFNERKAAQRKRRPDDENYDEEIEKIDEARRYVKHYFLSLGYLAIQGIINERTMRLIHTDASVATLTKVIWPLEAASGLGYEREAFKRLVDIYRP